VLDDERRHLAAIDKFLPGSDDDIVHPDCEIPQFSARESHDG